MPEETLSTLKLLGDAMLVLALVVGAVIIIGALLKGMAAHKKQHEELALADGIED